MRPVTDDPVERTVDGSVAVLRLARPETHNTLSIEMAHDLRAAIAWARESDSVRCVAIVGSGRSFAAGADIRAIRAQAVSENLAYNRELRCAIEDVARLPVPTIAAINGHALGGGLELALACTLRVAARDAVLGLPEVKLGILPGAGGTHRLMELVASGPALRMLLTGLRVDADAAFRMGLVDEEPTDDAEAAARRLAQRIAGNAPLAVRAILAAVREGRGLPLEDAIGRTEGRLAKLLESADCHEGLTAFVERRAPRFSGA